MPWWVWVLVVMLILSAIGGSATKSGRWDVARSTQGAINAGWIILLVVLFGGLGACLRDAACNILGDR